MASAICSCDAATIREPWDNVVKFVIGGDQVKRQYGTSDRYLLERVGGMNENLAKVLVADSDFVAVTIPEVHLKREGVSQDLYELLTADEIKEKYKDQKGFDLSEVGTVAIIAGGIARGEDYEDFKKEKSGKSDLTDPHDIYIRIPIVSP